MAKRLIGTAHEFFTVKVATREDNTLKLLKELSKQESRKAKVGLFDPDNAHKAYVAEFGDPTNKVGPVPPRPFMRNTLDNVDSKSQTLRNAILRTILDVDIAQAIYVVGELFVQFFREMIDSAFSWAQPLSPYTVKKKGHNKILKDTGEMYDKIEAKIE